VRDRWQRNAAVTAVGLLLLSACGSSGGGAADPGPQHMTRVMSLDFEQATAPLAAGARIASAIATGPGGDVDLAGTVPQPLRLVAGRDNKGHGVEFPKPCPATTEPTCAKAIIEVDDDAALNPGTNDYEWGASLLLDPNQTSEGSNVLQKGFSVGGGSQWKLQVDGDNGHPSCVVVGVGESTIHEVYANSTVADGTWHDVLCQRDGARLSITVDGGTPKDVAVPKTLSISPAGPVRIGGKSLKPNNDQYFGTLDDIFVATA
jgi:Laminin G domain